MTATPSTNARKFWPITALYAGVFLNAGLAEYLGPSFGLSDHVLNLCVLLSGYGVFLGACVFYPPARFSAASGRSLDEMICACLGPLPAWFFGKIALPIWAVTWFAYNSAFAT